MVSFKSESDIHRSHDQLGGGIRTAPVVLLFRLKPS